MLFSQFQFWEEGEVLFIRGLLKFPPVQGSFNVADKQRGTQGSDPP
jgi:hypothetical protein